MSLPTFLTTTYQHLKKQKLLPPGLFLKLLKRMASDSLISSPKFEPGSLFDLFDEDSSKVNVNLKQNQSLSYNSTSSQSTVANVDLKRYEASPGDVGNIGEAGDLLCLVSGSLLAVPAVVPAKATSWSPPSVGISSES
ncbi:hypothetical protein DSO57_1024777 [Entomophthora muscae]|uniref:Uncharacterized protein n=1 Tax=Entomophthora muscae TaxID=34485 RepID=A0ACC2SF91_9FUNG|nr:hypothetical protein DSO57_1024777 [Entomophthora muscae]